MSPKVSVCLPVYNGERFLKTAIESVLSQTFSDYELIICDDCSGDSSLEIARSFSDPRIRIYTNEKNLGLVGNWNRCISYAHGKYVKLMMQDDFLYPDAVLKQTELLEMYPNASICIGNTGVINENGDIIVERNRFKHDGVVDGIKFAKKTLWGRNLYCEPPNIMLRNELIKKIGPVDDSFSYAPDWDYCLMMSSVGDVAYTSTRIMNFRISDISETNRIFNKSAGASTWTDSDKMFLKHYNANVIPLRIINYYIFKVVIRSMALARKVVLKNRKKR